MTTLDTALSKLSPHELKLLGSTVNVRRAQQDFWEFARHIKTEDFENRSVRPYPVDYDYLHEYDEFLSSADVTLTLKSRRMLVSTHHVLKRLHKAWAINDRIDGSYKTVFLSQGEREAFDLVDRGVFMLNNMPEEFRVVNPADCTKSGIKFRNGGQIVSLPATAHGARTFGFSDAFCDEMAFWPFARQMWSALEPTTPHIDNVSTPNSKFDMYAKFWLDEEQYPDFARHRLHWSAHPDRDEAWAEMKRGRMDPQQWLREYEMSFVVMAGQPVYPTFDLATHVRALKFKPTADTVLYRGFDIGYRHPACIWTWRNPVDQLYVLKEYAPVDTDGRTFLRNVKELSAAMFQKCKYRNIVPHDARNKSFMAEKKAEQSFIDLMEAEKMSVDIINGVGLQAGLEDVRHLLKIRADGRAGIVINENECPILVEGFQGGYHYPERRQHEINVPVEEPFKDHWYDDPQDALRMIASNINKEIQEGRKKSYPKYEDYAEETDEFGG